MLDVVPDRLSNLLHAIGGAGLDRAPADRGLRVIAGRAVTVAAVDAERGARAENPRTGNPAGVDRITQGDIAEAAAAHDPDRGEAGLERLVRVRRAEQDELTRHFGDAGVLPVAVADRVPREMDVCVDEPRQHGRRREIDDRRAAGDLHVRADRRDAALLHENHGIPHRRRSRAVDERACTNGNDGGGGRRRSGGRRRLQKRESGENERRDQENFSLSFPKNPPPLDDADGPAPESASPNSIAVAKRSSGLVSSALVSAFSTGSGTSGRSVRTDWGWLRSRAIIISCAFQPWNGSLP